MRDRIKVLTLVGTRPELIKLCRVIAALDEHMDHVLVHTGQNFDYELNQVFFEDLDIRKPDHFLDVADSSAARTIGNVIAAVDEVLELEQPDAFLLLGDTNSCLGVISAKRRHIPIFHMEAGNRCFDLRVPEEINRRIIDHTSDINLPYTEHARRYLLDEGLAPETVIKTGSPMLEILKHYRPQIDVSPVLEDLGLRTGEFFVVSAHREENVDREDHLRYLLESLEAIADKYSWPIIFSVHPRTRARLDKLPRQGELDERIRFLKPLGFHDYVHLQMHAACVISDSGTITEESSMLGFPAITIRQAHERPEGMDEGTIIMSGLDPQRVLQSISIVMDQHASGYRTRLVGDYSPTDLSHKLVRLIASYTDYVNRTVWYKN